jgi:hypothetical protein
VDLDANEHETRIVGRAMTKVALLAEPDLPVGCKELPDLGSITRERCQAGHRNPFARSVFVVREVQVGVALDVCELAGPLSRDEPEVGTCCTLLSCHRTRLEVTVLAPRRHHRNLDLIDHLVELLELGHYGASSRSLSR